MKNKIIGKLYELEVTEGSLALSHGFKSKIKEIYVPEYNLCINNGIGNDDILNCFKAYADRYKGAIELKEIEIPDHIKNILVKYLERFEDDEKIKEWIKLINN